MRPSVTSTILALAVLWSAAFAAGAEPSGGGPQILVVSTSDGPAHRSVLEGFTQTLLREAPTAQFEVVWGDNDRARLDRQLSERSASRFDLALAIGTAATLAAAEAFPKIPVISTLTFSVTAAEFPPNVTTIALDHSAEQVFRILKIIQPKARTVGVIHSKDYDAALIEAAAEEARRQGLRLKAIMVDDPKKLPVALETLTRSVDVLWGIPDNKILNSHTALNFLVQSFRNRVPLIGPSEPWVKSGALYSLVSDYHDIGAQAAGLVHTRMRDGASVPRISAPHSTLFAINTKTLRHMKLDTDPGVIAGAYVTYE